MGVGRTGVEARTEPRSVLAKEDRLLRALLNAIRATRRTLGADSSVVVAGHRVTAITIMSLAGSGLSVASLIAVPAHAGSDDARLAGAGAPAPSCSLSADTTRIVRGDHVTLSWNSQYAASVSLDNGIGTVPPAGSRSASPAETTTYNLMVTGGSGSATCRATVSVAPAPDVRIDTDATGTLLNERDTITNTITVANGFAGKKIRMALVNHGAVELTPSLFAAARAGAAAVPGVSVTQIDTDGAQVEITLADGSYDIPITQTVTLGEIWGTTDDAQWAAGNQLQADWMMSSSPTDGARVNPAHKTVSRWITYARPMADRPAVASDTRWSILRSVPHIGTGEKVTFSIERSVYSPQEATSVRIGIDGASTATAADFTGTFDAAIAAALVPGVAYNASTHTLTFAASATLPFTFDMTAATVTANKDLIVAIDNASIGQIDVAKAGVRLGTSTVPAMTPVMGLNEASGEFGEGTPNVNFAYPGSDRLEWAASLGFGIVRVPFVYRNIQASPRAALDESRMSAIDRIVNTCTATHLICLLDLHNYGLYYRSDTLYGDASPGTRESPNSAFAELWVKIASRYKNNPSVWFGLMSEPHSQTALEWVKTANVAASAIRATGARNKIVFQGSYWDGAWKWQTTDNHTQMLKAYDPGDNYAFEAHQYLDVDGSGTHPSCVPGSGAARLRPFTTWLQTYGLHGIVGEVGWGPNADCATEAAALLDSWAAATTSTAAGGYIALTYWAAGPWWQDQYMFLAEPRPFPTGSAPPQLATLRRYLPH